MNRYIHIKKILFFIFINITLKSYSTHIVGGELNYKYLKNNYYEIRLTIYRDCYALLGATFDHPAALGIFDKANNLVTTLYMQFLSSDTIPNFMIDSNVCYTPPSNICYEVTTYIDTIYLPPIPGGYQLAYQRCCRNNTIVNIEHPETTGATYYTVIPDTSLAKNNSNPVFKWWPYPLACLNKTFTFDHSAVDRDGDSLVYEFFTPSHGASQNSPMPQPPNNPPYSTITWRYPFSVNNMLGDSTFTINSFTGLLTAKPNIIGQFVIGIKVKEYRKGIYIGETMRDFQLNVMDCPPFVVASAYASQINCGNFTVRFTNNSTGSKNYFWDFGDHYATNDTSNLFSTDYTYSDTGRYNVKLKAYSTLNQLCVDADSIIVYIYPQIKADAGVDKTICVSDTTLLGDSPNSNYVYSWNPINSVSNAHISNPLAYPDVATEYILLAIDTTTTCSMSDTVIVTVNESPIADFKVDSLHNSYNVQFINNSEKAIFYQWFFGDNTSSTETEPIHIYNTHGNYKITLVTTSPAGCTDTIYKWITIYSPHLLWIPNVFTPNGDGTNDEFYSVGENITCYHLLIFNRWGELLFEAEDINKSWDGTYKNKLVPDGVYVWTIKYCGTENGKEIEKELVGHVTVLK